MGGVGGAAAGTQVSDIGPSWSSCIGFFFLNKFLVYLIFLQSIGLDSSMQTRASAQRVTNTSSWIHFLIIKYFKVNDSDIRQAIVYNVTDLSFQEQLSWSK